MAAAKSWPAPKGIPIAQGDNAASRRVEQQGAGDHVKQRHQKNLLGQQPIRREDAQAEQHGPKARKQPQDVGGIRENREKYQSARNQARCELSKGQPRQLPSQRKTCMAVVKIQLQSGGQHADQGGDRSKGRGKPWRDLRDPGGRPSGRPRWLARAGPKRRPGRSGSLGRPLSGRLAGESRIFASGHRGVPCCSLPGANRTASIAGVAECLLCNAEYNAVGTEVNGRWGRVCGVWSAVSGVRCAGEGR